MKLQWFFSIPVSVLLLLSVMAVAFTIPASEKAIENSNADASPFIYKSGNDGGSELELHPPGLEKIVFIHYRKGYARPPWAGGGKKTQCYDFLGKWVKWKELPVNYIINPSNPDGLSEEFVTSAISAATEEWDSHTSAQLFGTYSLDYSAAWDGDAPDGRNEYVFGDYPDDNVIAVTVVWGYFSGPPQTRKITEYDVLFNTHFPWGDGTLDQTVMDLQNIATHETGHGLGLDDLYDTACSEETMYGYSNYGETKKRTLEAGDIAGIQELYGA